MTISAVSRSLINVSILNRLISKENPVILDATRNGSKKFANSHIPGARFFDQSRCVNVKPTCVHGFPEKTCFQKYVQDLGLRINSNIIIYDQDILPVSASRAKWTLDAYGFQNVSVLNGGLKSWISNDGHITDLVQPFEKSDCKLNLVDDLVVDFQKMKNILDAKSHVILDTRNLMNFKGMLPEPSPSTIHVLTSGNMPTPTVMRAGHMPGSFNFNLGQLVDTETGLVVEKKDVLEKVFADNNIELCKPIVTLCYNGNTASLLRLALNIIGKTDVSVYFGSWTEFGQMSTDNSHIL